MEIVSGVIVILLVIVIGILAYVVFRKTDIAGHEGVIARQEGLERQLGELTRFFEQKFQGIDGKITDQSRHVSESLRQQFSESVKIIRDITDRLGKLDQTNKEVLGFADQLQGLQDMLKNPKQRGVLGEYYLETVLQNVLPPGSFAVQYDLGLDEATGAKLIPDAVVFVKDKIIPIDSKFSLENYNRLSVERDPLERERLEKLFKQDLKMRIDETSKYVRPDKNTTEFAFMFIPHEAIYYDLLVAEVGALKVNTRDLVEYAFRDKHVIIVSPTSFLAYLQTVLQGLRGLEIEASAKEIIVRVGELEKHLSAYAEYHGKVGTTLGTLVNHYNASGKEWKKIGKDIYRLSGGKTLEELPSVDKPALAE